MAEEKPKYDFYENALFLDDPIQADLNRKKRTCAPKIGTEPRVSVSCFSEGMLSSGHPVQKQSGLLARLFDSVPSMQHLKREEFVTVAP